MLWVGSASLRRFSWRVLDNQFLQTLPGLAGDGPAQDSFHLAMSAFVFFDSAMVWRSFSFTWPCWRWSGARRLSSGDVSL